MSDDGPGRAEEVGVPPLLRGLVSRTLRAGILVASALLLAGLAVLGTSGNLDYRHVVAAPVGHLLLSSNVGLGDLLLGIGVMVLVFTPVVRVVISVALFASVRDRAFTAITLFVVVLFAITVVVGAYLA